MFSLNLKDVQSSTPLPEQIFTNESEFEVVRQATDFLTANYPDAFPNPVTAERKLSEVVKTASGLTQSEEFKAGIDAQVNTLLEAQQSILAPIKEKYRTLRDEEHQSHESKEHTLTEQKNSADSEETRERIQVELDEAAYQHSATMTSLSLQEEKETLEALEKFRSTHIE